MEKKEVNKEEKGVNKKPEQITFDVILFKNYTGNRVYTDKRFPNGHIRITFPAPLVTFPEEIDKLCKDLYNRSAQEMFEAGIVQSAYGERDWDILKYKGEPSKDVPSDEVFANIKEGLGVGVDEAEFEEMIVPFFEEALFREVKEKSKDETKITAKKLKAAGVSNISDEEIQAIIALRQRKNQTVAD